jgi:hypothetical protein
MTADSDGVEERASGLAHAVESLLRELLRDSTRTPKRTSWCAGTRGPLSWDAWVGSARKCK